mmetsp:Transcript_66530/g.124104  ORF Transcript_66530/g.124104 Transcript_66530/m.124104 type:complete len:141 (+) Transcript_66530:25-447(+)
MESLEPPPLHQVHNPLVWASTSVLPHSTYPSQPTAVCECSHCAAFTTMSHQPSASSLNLTYGIPYREVRVRHEHTLLRVPGILGWFPYEDDFVLVDEPVDDQLDKICVLNELILRLKLLLNLRDVPGDKILFRKPVFLPS